MHVPNEHSNHPSSDVLSVTITVRVIALLVGVFVGASILILIQINISNSIKCGKLQSKHGEEGMSVQMEAQGRHGELKFSTAC